MSENGKIQYKIGDRVRFRPVFEHEKYRDRFKIPNEFTITKFILSHDPTECCLIVSPNNAGIAIYGSRLELVEAAKPTPVTQEKLIPEVEVPVRKGETRWGLVDKDGKIIYILSTRQIARDIRDCFLNQYKVKKLTVTIAKE